MRRAGDVEYHVNDQRNTGVGEAPSDEQSTNGAATAAAAEDFDKLRAERDEFKDLLLRKSAEFDNYRRRNEKERRELSEYANADLLTDILPLLDNLERALGSAADTRTPGSGRGADSLSRRRRADPPPVPGIAAEAGRHADRGARHRFRSASPPGRDARSQRRASRRRSDGGTAARLQARRPAAAPGHGEGGDA